MTTKLIVFVAVFALLGGVFPSSILGQSCEPPPNGLVAWYRGEGNASDSSGSGNHGVMGSAGTTPGHVGQAFHFTAQNQSAVIPNHPSLFPPSSLTIEGWVNPNNYASCSGAYRIFHTVQTIVTGYVPFINCANGKLHGAIFDSAGIGEQVISNASVPTGTYTHFAMTWDGSNLRIYLNGALDNTAATTIPSIGTNSIQLRIGNDQALGFLGQIDEVSLYNRALSGSEVLSIFNAGTAGKCAVPTAANVFIAGRVTTAAGVGIGGIRLSMTAAGGSVRFARTSPFGYYRFDDVEAGGSYVITVINSKRYTFADPTRFVSASDSITDVDFIASP